MPELAGLGVLELAELLHARTISSREAVVSCLESIECQDRRVGAWARTYPDSAIEQAEAADERLSPRAERSLGPAPPLCGMPVGLKDVIAVAGKPLTLGSEAFADSTAASDATAWARLRAEGAVLIGHNRTQELALGNAPQDIGNPWDPTRSPGGSSNGSAVAVAAAMVPVALGTDVGGSLRRPASACGLSTIMATAGAVSTDGAFSFDAVVDHIGPLARSAADCAALLDAIAVAPPPLTDLYWPPRQRAPFRGRWRLGVAAAGAGWDSAAALAPLLERCCGELESLGAEVIEFRGPPAPSLDRRPRQEQVDFFRAHLPRRGRAFSPPVREQGEELLRVAARDGVRSDRVNRDSIAIWRRQWEELFAKLRLNALILPAQTRETPPLPVAGAGGDLDRFGDPQVRAVWNQLGLPVLCVPAGPIRAGGMPLGVQLVGPAHSEADLLRIGIAYQESTSHHRRRPQPPAGRDSV